MLVSSKALLLFLAGAALAVKRQSDPVDPSTATDCTYLLKARDSSWTCARFEDEGGIDHADFVSWNPSVKDDCSGIKIGNAYCVEVNYGLPRTTAVTSTSTTTTTSDSQTSTTTSAPTASLPSPTQDGLAKDCSQFYLAKSGDTCNGIVAAYGSFSLDEFLAWNPAVGRTCNLLLSGSYYCVDTPNRITTSSTTTTVAATSTTLGNGIATPQPTQPGMVKDCVKFHYVFPGNTCGQITSYNGISQQDFARWNPQVGEGCTALWANTYACVGVAAFSLKSRYRVDCTGEVHNNVAVKMNEGYCINTDCQVGSLEIATEGLCEDGEVQLSYWEQPGCTGEWYGFGYASKGTCRGLWTQGWKFKAIHLRCTRSQDDCISAGRCTIDPEPQGGVC